MNLSLRMPRTSAFDQVSRFITWHQRHHQDCSETTTNLFSAAARAKVASVHSLQNPSRFSIGAARAPMANSSDSSKIPTRIMVPPPGGVYYVNTADGTLCPIHRAVSLILQPPPGMIWRRGERKGRKRF